MQLCNWPGWWCSDSSQALLTQLQSEDVFEKRKEIFAQLQENFYKEVPMIKLGDTNAVEARSKKLMNLSPQSQLGPQLWNAWLKK
jgi:peptide/nickel transport system substrate-binding protein